MKIYYYIYLSMASLLLAACCSGKGPRGVKEGKLGDCPRSPNCVSTVSTDPDHRMDPIPYRTSLKEAREKVITIVNKMKRTRIITSEDRYLHVEFRSAIFRFVDDVEFYFDEDEKMIHFRSASRLGYSDLGVNRKRMQRIRILFNE
jgi:uncharacterized protein (DUF1499 family)